MAARQSVKSQLYVGKQPTKNQAVKIGQPKTWPYQTPKRYARATTWKKTAKRVDHQSESSECSRRPLNLRISFKKNLKGYFAKKMSFFLLAAAWVGPGRSALQSAEQWCRDIIVKSTSWVRCQFLTVVQKHAEGQ